MLVSRALADSMQVLIYIWAYHRHFPHHLSSEGRNGGAVGGEGESPWVARVTSLLTIFTSVIVGGHIKRKKRGFFETQTGAGALPHRALKLRKCVCFWITERKSGTVRMIYSCQRSSKQHLHHGKRNPRRRRRWTGTASLTSIKTPAIPAWHEPCSSPYFCL